MRKKVFAARGSSLKLAMRGRIVFSPTFRQPNIAMSDPFPPPSVLMARYKIQLPQSGDSHFVNAFRIEKSIFPGHCFFAFATVISGEIVGTVSFTIENGSLLDRKANFLQYLLSLKAAEGRPEFVRSVVEVPITKAVPRTVDHIVLTQSGHTAEFALFGWSWAATQRPPQTPEPSPPEVLISAHLHVILRCTVALQIEWLEELYGDDARNQPRQLLTFDATPKQF